MALFGPREEESYEKALQMGLTSKPSALLKNLADELCDCSKKLEKCCSAKTVSAMWKKQLPQPVRSAVAGRSLAAPGELKEIMKRADDTFASLSAAAQVSAISAPLAPQRQPELFDHGAAGA